MRWTIAILMIGACGAGATGDDLGAALPRVEELGIEVPGDAAAAKPGLAELAPLYVVARRTSEQLNGIVAGAVGAVADIAAHPPTLRAPGRAVWGPIVAPLSPAAFRLVAEAAEGGVRYRLEGWPRAGGEARLVAAGRAAPDGHAGELHVDLAALRALDPVAAPEGERLDVAYGDGALALEHDGAHYRYARDPAGGARFVFAAADGGSVSAAWGADGAGRAEVAGGIVECWDARFLLVACVDGP